MAEGPAPAPALSIVVPVYNGAATVGELVAVGVGGQQAAGRLLLEGADVDAQDGLAGIGGAALVELGRDSLFAGDELRIAGVERGAAGQKSVRE